MIQSWDYSFQTHCIFLLNNCLCVHWAYSALAVISDIPTLRSLAGPVLVIFSQSHSQTHYTDPLCPFAVALPLMGTLHNITSVISTLTFMSTLKVSLGPRFRHQKMLSSICYVKNDMSSDPFFFLFLLTSKLL